jgi:hypothetical protein
MSRARQLIFRATPNLFALKGQGGADLLAKPFGVSEPPFSRFGGPSLMFCVMASVARTSRAGAGLYRGFLIRRRRDRRMRSRLEVGDTAGWKPALQKRAGGELLGLTL